MQTGLHVSTGANPNAPLLPKNVQPPATCDRCAVTFATLGIMLKHRDRCDGKRSTNQPHIKTTPSVTKPTVSITKTLTTEKADPAKSFGCTFCGKVFARRQYLKSHLPVHTKVKAFACNQCNKRFTHRSNLRDHERIHSGVTPYSCPYCDKKFNKSSNRKSHLIIHTQAGPFDCMFCQEKFRQFTPLLEHLSKEHAGQKAKVPHPRKKKTGITCQQCHKVLYNTRSLGPHMLIHTGERPYECQHCPQKFRTIGLLNAHMPIHTGKKPYACSWCGKQFSQAHSWKMHLYTHDVDKPFVCEFCKEQFAAYKGLVLHHQIQHKPQLPS